METSLVTRLTWIGIVFCLNQSWYWHQPILIENCATRLGNILHRLTVKGTQPHDNLIEQDISKKETEPTI